MRMGFFALLATVCLLLGGCSDAKTNPPPGTDTETPDLNIDTGGITTPDGATADDATGAEASKKDDK